MTATEFSVPLPALDDAHTTTAPTGTGSDSPGVATAPADPAPTPSGESMAQRFRLVRSRTDRKLGGVCGGLGAAFGIDATLIRIGFVGAAFAGFGIPVYLAAWILAPAV